MIELELKSVVPDLDQLRQTLAGCRARLVFEGELQDRRYDTPDRRLLSHDEVLRVRVYRGASGASAQLDWKGPTSLVGGYKQREELSTSLADADTLAVVLERLGFVVAMAIDRHIWQYELDGATLRLERYPRMDDLIEVEGSAETIERAIRRIGLPRAGFNTDRLRDFVARYQARTGDTARVSNAATGAADYDAAANA
jgi:predicted adenylyl cyclase CyaB